MHDYELANLHYSYLIGLYKANDDNEVLEELNFLKNNYKHFPFDKFVAGVFKKDIIDEYSLEFLIKTSRHRSSSIYRYGMVGEEEKEKVIYFLNSSNMNKITEETVKFLNLIELKRLQEFVPSSMLAIFLILKPLERYLKKMR